MPHSSITDIRLNDLIKFSRPGGKISKGIVKYIGPLPGKTDQYLGLELEDEGKTSLSIPMTKKNNINSSLARKQT